MKFANIKEKIISALDDNNNNNAEFNSISLVIPSTFDAINLLKNYRGNCKIYFSNPNSNSDCVAIGSLKEFYDFEELETFVAKYDVRAYGGTSFDNNSSKDKIWNEFKSFRFVIPLIELRQGKNNIIIKINYKSKNQIYDILELFDDDIKEDVKSIKNNPILKKTFSPDKTEWAEIINKSLKLFESKELEKIVIARKTNLQYEYKLDAVNIFYNLLSQAENSYKAFYCFDNKATFMSISPEKLYARTNNIISSDSLAGTRSRGTSQAEDKELEQKLLNSKKETNEHNFVTQSILASLSTICKDVKISEQVHIKKFKNVQHLHCEIKGTLKQGVSDFDILSTLHPTPAVGGLPKQVAMDYISELEGFDRGWYASPLGYIDKDNAEFCVAIRSGLAIDNNLYLYTGAGIVPGSIAEYEWEEINKKMKNFLNVI